MGFFSPCYFPTLHQISSGWVQYCCASLHLITSSSRMKNQERSVHLLHGSILNYFACFNCFVIAKMNLLKNNTNPKYVLTQQAQNHWVSSKFILFSLCKSFICNYPIHLYLNCNKCKCSKQYLFQLHMFFKHTKEELRKSRKGKNRNQKNCIKFNLQLIGRSWSPWH